MDRLVFLVIGVGNEHRAQLVEAQHPVIFRVINDLALGRRLQRMGVGLAVLEAAGAADQAEATQKIGRRHFQAADQRAEIGAEAAHKRFDVAHQLELLGHVRMVVGGLVSLQNLRRLARADRLIGRVGREYPRLHGVVRALDARHVDEAGRAADQGAPREDQTRHGLETALVDGAGAVRDPRAAFEVLADHRMVLQALELVVGRQVRVLVVEVDDEAHGDIVVAEMIEERPAAGLVTERPAQRMLDQARPMLVVGDLPQLLQADAVFLHVGPGVELEFLDDELAQRAARPFGQERVFGAQFQARLIIGLGLAVAVDAEDAGDDAGDRAVGLIEHFGARHAGIDLDAQRLGLFGQPARQVAEAGYITAVIVHIAGLGQGRDVHRTLGAQIDELVLVDRGFQRRAKFFPVGEEFD